MTPQGAEPDQADLLRALARDPGIRPSVRIAARQALATVLGEGRQREAAQRRFGRALRRLRAEADAAP